MRRFLFAAFVSLFLLVNVAESAAQTRSLASIGFQVLYNFTDHLDGCCLYGGLARDRGGNLYGVAYINEGASSGGDIFKLTRGSTAYSFHVLHSFSVADGLCITTPTLDSHGNLYGVCTQSGGTGYGSLWEYSNTGKFSVLHEFNGPTDGGGPQDAVALDHNGNIYGTAYGFGAGTAGTLWEYAPASATFTVLHAFANGADGGRLPAGPRIDSSGKIWGTTASGPNCYFCGTGTVWSYDLTTSTFTTVLDFGNSGVNGPPSRLALDAAGNFYGTAFGLTQGNCGLVYELEKSNNYAPVILYSFTGKNGDGCESFGDLTLDSQGNIFGTTYSGGNSVSAGTVFELQNVNGTWQETILHDFSISDGLRPQTGLVTDGSGNWFGTASTGGTGKAGTVFEISGVQ
jgi:uncharacterized repeat protein (TIGR03803 family)